MSNICGRCAYYTRRPYNEDICAKTGKLAPYMDVKPCWAEVRANEENTMEQEQKEQVCVLLQTKKCPTCGRELPLDAFGKNKCNKDGLQGQCKDCMKKYWEKSKKVKKGVKKPAIDVKTATRAEKEAYLAERLGLNEKCIEALKTPSPLEDYVMKEIPRALLELDGSQILNVKYSLDHNKQVHIADADLAAELRRRGWEVKCTKTTVIEL